MSIIFLSVVWEIHRCWWGHTSECQVWSRSRWCQGLDIVKTSSWASLLSKGILIQDFCFFMCVCLCIPFPSRMGIDNFWLHPYHFNLIPTIWSHLYKATSFEARICKQILLCEITCRKRSLNRSQVKMFLCWFDHALHPEEASTWHIKLIPLTLGVSLVLFAVVF